MPNIYLIGMMGAGKTTTGRALAKLLEKNFADLDERIEKEGHLTINEIFRTKGETYFRAQEKRVLREAAHHLTDTVVATGGGIVLNPENIEQMRQTGRLIYLATSIEVLWARVKEKKDRPLLSSPDPRAVLQDLFKTRTPLYESACHERFMTDGLRPEEVALQIVEKVRRGHIVL